MKDYYFILGIPSNATSGQIKIAWRRLALLHHPDKNKEITDNRFVEINEAYHILSDPNKRMLYDQGHYSALQEKADADARPKRKPPPYFYYQQAVEKTTYSRKVYFQTTLLVVTIIAFAIGLPIFLLKSTSRQHYQRALEDYSAGRYYTSLQNIDLSIRDMSDNNAEACALASVILVHKIPNYDFALRYVNRALDYSADDSLNSELHYLKGICLAKLSGAKNALTEYEQVGTFSNTYDSSRLRMAAIYLRNGDNALAETILDSLLIRNPDHWAAVYLYGILLEQQEKVVKAHEFFSDLLKTPYNKAAVYYHLARTEIKMNLPDSACAHLRIAGSYNLMEAQQLLSLYCESDSISISP